MASSSTQSSSNTSSSIVKFPWRNSYDVFVSFRGKDTRLNFTNHLFAALQRKGIYAFKDDTKLNKGESIAPELFRAIQDSQIFIVVFSKNYASSTWCLRELQHILLHCGQHSEKRILPVFYDVDPSEVRHQKETYGEALAKHAERFKQDSEKVQKWRTALSQVADLSGWDVRHKPQHAEIEDIVDQIINKLVSKFSSLPKDLVGIHPPMWELEKNLVLDSLDDVRVVGIYGMGGIGKTTLAKAVHNKISHQFDVCCFIDDLSKSYKQDGLISAQKETLLQIAGEEQLQTCNSYNTPYLIRRRLHRVRALITIDNVDQVKQLEELGVDRECLGPGSRIIITSRDKHIFEEYGVDAVYPVPHLNRKNSLQLLSRRAFKLDHIVSSYDKLAQEIVYYAGGLPLAIKVLGSFLCGRNISEWKSALARLRESPNKDIMDVLRLSFDGLEEPEQEIFLHIACFFHYGSEKYVTNVLKCCGLKADIGLKLLIEKSLIILSEESRIQMHASLEDLGIKIAQEEPRKWSRVWLEEQFDYVKLEKMEEKVKAICNERGKDLMIKAETLSKMSHLRLLILIGVDLLGNLSCLSNELRYMEWVGYPCKYLPSSFQPSQLVELILSCNNIKQLWKDKKCLPHLRKLDLSHSINLRKMPDFEDIPNLEKLSFEGCVKLVHMDPSIGVLRKLVFLTLEDCINLVSIPDSIFGLSSLKYVNLSGCRKLFKNPRISNIRGNTSQSQSTMFSILKWTVFHHSLCSRAPKDLRGYLLPFLVNFSNLRDLDISFCGLSQLPDAIGCLRWLEELNLGGNKFVRLPSLKELHRLVFLNLEHCKLLESLPELPFRVAIAREHREDIQIVKKGLVIFNCPNLSEKELGSTISYSWMPQFIQANEVFTNEIYFVVPGSEIPSWCNNQSEGNLIRLDLSPIMSGNYSNISGIACCTIFSAAPLDPTRSARRTGIEIGICNSKINIWHGKRLIPVILEGDLIEINSDHLCLIYFPLKSFIYFLKCLDETFSDLDHFKLYVSICNCAYIGFGEVSDLKVKKCGYHWVYKQDHASQLKLLSSEVQVLAIENDY
ncbi:disease resistance protein RUN1-like [Vicia villosa]|uniref:disease resistance protein RUN1-like n=1 Tax=Vicia villosa TaxID=3911 RepID=UPI00273C05CF|nr:disease resistance protein RUN1-like [Vicia villosa]